MRDPCPELRLQPAEPTPSPAAQRLVDGYAAEIRNRRSDLLDDLAIYQSKLNDLEQLDPLDFTGLGNLYRNHVDHIRSLLKEFNDAA
jgi:hypothetical protein